MFLSLLKWVSQLSQLTVHWLLWDTGLWAQNLDSFRTKIHQKRGSSGTTNALQLQERSLCIEIFPWWSFILVSQKGGKGWARPCSPRLHERGASQSVPICASICVGMYMRVVYMRMAAGRPRGAAAGSERHSLPSRCAQTQPWYFFLHLLPQQPFLRQEGRNCNPLWGWCGRCGAGGLSKGPASFPRVQTSHPWGFPSGREAAVPRLFLSSAPLSWITP